MVSVMPDSSYIVADWPAPAGVRAVSTTRVGGVSRPPYDAFNLADHVGDTPEAVAENRRRLMVDLDLTHSPLWLRQVHGASVVNARTAAVAVGADGSFCDGSGAVCAVLTADCVPILLCDRDGRRVAALHAGWRGLARGVIEAGVAAMAQDGVDLMAWLGPAIGPRAFVIGEDVRAAFTIQDSDAAAAFAAAGENGRWHADLFALARMRLRRCGVQAIYGQDRCTYTHPQEFFSYRRNGQCGRMASLIWID